MHRLSPDTDVGRYADAQATRQLLYCAAPTYVEYSGLTVSHMSSVLVVRSERRRQHRLLTR